jgi:sulfate adenylyltransferase subunit 2
MPHYHLDHLDQLEAEAIFVLRETAAQFQNAALLFSGGKDSIVMAHLAAKAFWPAKIPFPLLHVDTGHNFEETLAYRDSFAEKIGARLVIGSVQASIDSGRVKEEKGPYASRNALQTVTLLDTIKERFFSHRDDFGQWDPKNQRPELWNLFNGKHHPGEHFRVFPLSNFTEMDVWMYIQREKIELPSLYFTHERDVFERGGSLLAVSPFITMLETEKPVRKTVRFRTIGDVTCTGAVESAAANLDEVIAEVAAARQTERGTRADDKRSETAMEDRKREGYF